MNKDLESVRKSRRIKLLISLVAVCSGLLIGLGSYSDHSFFKSLDYYFYDQFMKLTASDRDSGKITVVDIDETSLSAVGQWPWPRYRLARLLEIIHDMQPKAIGLDIILPEPDRTSLQNIQKQFKQDFDLDLKFSGVPPALDDNDAYLAHIVKKTETVGARYFYFDHFNKKDACSYTPFHITGSRGLLDLHIASGVLCNAVQIENAYLFNGFTNNQYDEDGLIRQTPLLIEHKDHIFTHLSLSSFLKAEGISKAAIDKNMHGLFIRAGTYKIPISRKGDVLIRFDGPAKNHTTLSAVDVFNMNVSPTHIKDKIIVIGSSAVGLNDIHPTIFDSQFPGVEVHAKLIDNIYTNRHIIRPVWAPHIVFFICMTTAILMALGFYRSTGPSSLLFGSIILLISFWVLCLFVYKKMFFFISPGLPGLMTIVLFSVFSFIRFIRARQASFIWFKKLASSMQLTMEAMVSMVETRDPETGLHIKRTQHYALALANHLKEKGCFPETLTEDFIRMLFLSVPLHDIGKVGVPDRILLKPGKLSREEFEQMKLHASHGKTIIQRAAKNIEGDNYLRMGARVAGGHHERWDGKGYPEGIKGENIPLEGRIMAIVDVYDALVSMRCYKPSFSHEKSMKIILEEKSGLFDPVIVDAFLEIEEEIIAISKKFEDPVKEDS